MEPKVLVINRATWRRGGDDDKELKYRFGRTQLLNEKGFMCCLGFDAVACGVPTVALIDQNEPCELGPDDRVPAEYLESRLEALREYDDDDEYYTTSFGNVQAVFEAMDLNDDKNIDDAERERRLVPVLKQLGWDDVVFVG